jgi:hypothetical protein
MRKQFCVCGYEITVVSHIPNFGDAAEDAAYLTGDAASGAGDEHLSACGCISVYKKILFYK